MDANIMIKVSKEFKEILKQEAKEKNLTLSAYIKSIINERIK